MNQESFEWVYHREMRKKAFRPDISHRIHFAASLRMQLQAYLAANFECPHCNYAFMDESREKIRCVLANNQIETAPMPHVTQFLDFIRLNYTGWENRTERQMELDGMLLIPCTIKNNEDGKSGHFYFSFEYSLPMES